MALDVKPSTLDGYLGRPKYILDYKTGKNILNPEYVPYSKKRLKELALLDEQWELENK